MRAVRAIVTGGAGFIGSHVVDALVARGEEVTVVDSLVHGREENVSNGAEAVFAALTGLGSMKDANDACPHADPDHGARIAEVRKWNGI